VNLNKLVLDSSAILAVVNAEPGHEKLTEELLAGAVASTVNLAEVQTKLVTRGWPSE
jgi:PIN domain nuclease of toxin-antitoxin system